MPENVRKMSDEEPMSDGGSASPVSRASTNPSPSAELEAVSPKHPLQSDWTLWYFKNDKSKSWDANLKSVSVTCLSQNSVTETSLGCLCIPVLFENNT